ncbi:MAG TPA: AfsA-related hotdog domain-containing protein [Pseudonocardiaceae bacterium]
MPEPELLGMRNTTTVDRRLAHKESTEQVFINDVARDGETLVALGELPRSHRFFNDSAIPRYDALLLAEFIRQGVEVIAHALLDVPLTSQFVLRSVELELVDRQATVIGDRAMPVVVALPASQVRRNRGGMAYAATGPVYCFIDGRPAARFGGKVGFLACDTYGEIRAAAPLGVPGGSVAACEPRAVGRQFRENVFIGRPWGYPRGAKCLVVPRPHPAFFDRPLDHYPGMMLAEAARQLAASSLAADAHVPISSVCTDYAAMDFVSFAELDTSPTLTVVDWIDLDDGAELTVTARQGARTMSTYTFRMFHDDYSEDRS